MIQQYNPSVAKLEKKGFYAMDEQDELGPNVERIFKKMLDGPYHGRVKYSHLSKMSPLDFPNKDHFQAHKDWFKEHDGIFACFENAEGKVSMYGVRVREAKLCGRYLLGKEADVENTCQNPDCQLLHLCTRFLDERCLRCHLSHRVNDDHNRKILSSPFFEKFSMDDQLKIIKLSQPQVCPHYNEDGICNHHDQCTRLHVCQKFILGKCPEEPTSMLEPDEGASSVGCPLSHSLTSPHSLRLLRNFGVRCTADSLPDVYCQILAPKKPKKVSKDNSEKIRDFFACLKWSIAGSRSSSGCSSPKRSKKSTSCWSVEFIGNWYNFDAEVDENIEKEFSDPNSSQIVVPCPKEIQKYLPECLQMTLNFDELVAHLDDGHQTVNIKRAELLDDRFVYLWYFQNSQNQWDILDENDKIEAAYKSNKVRACITSDDGRKLRVKFSDMSLLDRNVGDTFKVRRRPFLVN